MLVSDVSVADVKIAAVDSVHFGVSVPQTADGRQVPQSKVKPMRVSLRKSVSRTSASLRLFQCVSVEDVSLKFTIRETRAPPEVGLIAYDFATTHAVLFEWKIIQVIGAVAIEEATFVCRDWSLTLGQTEVKYE